MIFFTSLIFSHQNPSLLTGACFVSDVEMFQDDYPNPVKASLFTYPAAQPTMQPGKPSLNVLSKPIFISSLLIKPTRTDNRTIGFAERSR
jgi:hypothetical protein